MNPARPQRIQIFSVGKRKGDNRKSPWVVRWKVDGKETNRHFPHKTVADRFRQDLDRAHRSGERFDAKAGLPVSWITPDVPNVADWCKNYLELDYADAEPRSRRNLAETVIPLIERSTPAKAPRLDARQELKDWLAGQTELSANTRKWIDRWSPRLDSLDRAALSDILTQMKLRVDLKASLGSETAKMRVRQTRQILNAAAAHGVVDDLDWPPIEKGAKRKADWGNELAKQKTTIDVGTFEKIVRASSNSKRSSGRYRCMTAFAGYCGLRPSEIFALRVEDLTLPEGDGEGMVRVERASIATEDRWMPDDRETIGLPKSLRSIREVPLPAAMVAEVRRWMEIRQVTSGPLFNNTGSPKHWPDSLRLACSKLGREPLAPYDLRKAYASNLVKNGFSIAEVAELMGHSVKVLLEHYIHPVEGTGETVAARISNCFGGTSLG